MSCQQKDWIFEKESEIHRCQPNQPITVSIGESNMSVDKHFDDFDACLTYMTKLSSCFFCLVFD
jgi:hypothetical protein